MTEQLYRIIPNPLASLTDAKIVEVGRWLEVMEESGVVWREAKVSMAKAHHMVSYIISKDPSLNNYLLVCPAVGI